MLKGMLDYSSMDIIEKFAALDEEIENIPDFKEYKDNYDYYHTNFNENIQREADDAWKKINTVIYYSEIMFKKMSEHEKAVNTGLHKAVFRSWKFENHSQSKLDEIAQSMISGNSRYWNYDVTNELHINSVNRKVNYTHKDIEFLHESVNNAFLVYLDILYPYVSESIKEKNEDKPYRFSDLTGKQIMGFALKQITRGALQGLAASAAKVLGEYTSLLKEFDVKTFNDQIYREEEHTIGIDQMTFLFPVFDIEDYLSSINKTVYTIRLSQNSAQMDMMLKQYKHRFDSCVEELRLEREKKVGPDEIMLGVMADVRHYPNLFSWIRSGSEEEAEERNTLINYPHIHVKFNKGSLICTEYTQNAGDYSERYALSFLSWMESWALRNQLDRLASMDHIDPLRMDDSALGVLRPLADQELSILSHVPISAEAIRKRLEQIINEGRENNDERIRFIAFHSFPESYDLQTIQLINRMILNAEQYNLCLLFTHCNDFDNTVNRTNLRTLDIIKDNGIYLETDGQMLYILLNQERKIFSPSIQYASAIPVTNATGASQQNDSNNYEDRIGFNTTPISKGNRNITNIPYGIDSKGQVLSLNFEGSDFATFIAGASRSGKSTLLHTILTGLISNYNPDDIEIWLIDFKMTEFSRYIEHTPPHVRYILLDESPEIVYDLLDRLHDILIKRQNIFKGRWLKLSDVPADRYMPAMFIIIDEFSVMSQVVADSLLHGKEDYRQKLQTLLARGAALGMHFIFSSQGFTSGSMGLNDFSKKQIQQRIAMKTEYEEIKATLDLKTTSDMDKQMMEQLEVHHTLMRVPEDKYGNHLVKAKVIYIQDYEKQEEAIDELNVKYLPTDSFYPAETSRYVNKQLMIIEGERYHTFKEHEKDMRTQVSSGQSDSQSIKLFVGEPRRMMKTYPISLSPSFSENILVVGANEEKSPIASIILSIKESLSMQNKQMRIWSASSSSLLQEIIDNDLEKKIGCVTGLDDVCENIRSVRNRLEAGTRSDEVVVLLGLETLIQNMKFFKTPDRTERTMRNETNPLVVNLRDFLDKELKGDTIGNRDSLPIHSVSSKTLTGGLYDAREDLKYLLTYGAKSGYHFIAVFQNCSEFIQTKLDVSLFQHKLLFGMAKQDTIMLGCSSNADSISSLRGHSFRYVGGTQSLSYKPYLHVGLSWDGWIVDGNGNAVIESYEDLLLL